jgi:hypothetical protein
MADTVVSQDFKYRQAVAFFGIQFEIGQVIHCTVHRDPFLVKDGKVCLSKYSMDPKLKVESGNKDRQMTRVPGFQHITTLSPSMAESCWK